MRTTLLTATATATAIVAVAAVPASAGGSGTPPRGCAHLIADPRGDAKEWFLPGSPYNPDADLLYLDARATASTIKLTATLARVEAKPVAGTEVVVYFTVSHQGRIGDYEVDVSHNIDGDSFSLQDDDTLAVTPIAGSTNTSAGTFTFYVPRKTIQSAYRGAVLDQLGVIVAQTFGVSLANGGFIEQSTGPGHKYVADLDNCQKS